MKSSNPKPRRTFKKSAFLFFQKICYYYKVAYNLVMLYFKTIHFVLKIWRKERCSLFVNPVDLKRDQHRQLQVMRLRAEQRAPDFYINELAEARWQIRDLTKKLEQANRINRALANELALMQAEVHPCEMDVQVK